MKCCANPATMNMDHKKGFGETKIMIVNRMCHRCGKHWYGEEGKVKEYTKAEWDAYVNSAFDDLAR